VLLTTPFALAGGAAPVLWLVVARTGALLALAGAARVAGRLGGRGAGAAAALAMALSPWWAFHAALGNSEGLLAAAVLWAIAAHLEGRRRLAFALGAAAALLRPEVWPFLALYGAWLWRAEPGARRVVAAAGALVPLLWLGPDLIGAGGALGASDAARGTPSRGSARNEAIPALAVLADGAELLTFPATLAAAFAVAAGRGLVRWLALGAVAWVAIVAAMAQAGYAGNPRYLVAAAALGAALAGAGAVRAATAIADIAAPVQSPRGDAARRLAAPLGAAVLVAAVLAITLGDLRDQSSELSSRADASSAFTGAIAAAGGRDALVGCSRIRTSHRARSLVAWRLDLPLRDLDAGPERPAVVIRAKWFYGQGLEPPVPDGFRTLVASPYWQIVAVCGPAPQLGT
jgi:hypothetical protein